MQIDKELFAWPEQNLYFAHAGKRMYIADASTKNPTSFVPCLPNGLTEGEIDNDIIAYSDWQHRGNKDGLSFM